MYINYGVCQCDHRGMVVRRKLRNLN